MTEAELQIEQLKVLLEAFVRINQIISEPGDKAHCIWDSRDFLKKQIKELFK